MPDILKQLFGEYGFSDFRFKLSGTYEPREYCVQYRETDFNFVSRLLEEEGIYYFFDHEDGKHTLVLADTPSAHDAVPGAASVRFMQQQRPRPRKRTWSPGSRRSRRSRPARSR